MTAMPAIDTTQRLEAIVRSDQRQALKAEVDVAALQASIRRDERREKDVKRRVQEDGDATLFAWGDAKRTGMIESVLMAGGAGLEANGRKIKAPGTHSNPTEAAVAMLDSLALKAVLMVEIEVEWWREDKHTRVWAKIADLYYATAGHATNGSVARALKISERSVERCRGQMRRMVLMAAQRACHSGGLM